MVCHAQEQGGRLVPVRDSITNLNVYDFVTESPTFPSGEITYLRYINKN